MLNDQNAEAAALNCLQLDPQPLLSQLEEDDFSENIFRRAFVAMKNSYRDSRIDIMDVEDVLNDNYRWLKLVNDAPFIGAPHQILRRLRILRARREAKDFRVGKDANSMPEAFIGQGNRIRAMLTFRQDDREAFAERIRQGVPKLATGFQKLDWLCNGGIEHGGILVIAAMPGTGKTALATTIASNITEANKSTCFISLEMSPEAIATRMFQSFWNKPEDEVRANAYEASAALNYFHPIMPGNDISAVIGAMTEHLDSDLFVIDYFDLIDMRTKDSHTQKLELISHQLKHFAMEHKKPMIVLSQLSKDLEKSSTNREPVLGDLHGTSALAKDAHVISFLWDKKAKGREEKEVPHAEIEKRKQAIAQNEKPNTHQKDDGRDLRWLIKKNRNGRLGMVHLDFNPEHMKFSELEDTNFRL